MFLIAVETYRNGTLLYSECRLFKEDFCHAGKTYNINWDNLTELYWDLGIYLPFNVWNFKRGRIVSFFIFNIFKKNTWDIIEWRKLLDITIKFKIINEYDDEVFD